MKRLALLVASVAALVLFTACPNPDTDTDTDTDKDLYYSEDIALNYQFANGNDTTFYFTQEFTKVENAIIYNPSSSINSVDPYIYFADGYTCSIINDSIYYPRHLDAHNRLINYLFPQIKAKVEYAGKKSSDFTFQYILQQEGGFVLSAKHTCHRIDRLSD